MYASLNINNRSIKVLSIKGRQVKKWGSLSLASGLVRDGLILQPPAVGEAIASLFKSTKTPKEKVITSLSGLAFTYRFINLPRMKPALLDEAIRRTAKKEISLPLDELYLSWQLLPGQGEERTYFILGVPRHFVDALAATLKIAGIEPYLMDLSSLALARTAGCSDAIVVNMEPDCYDIVFIAQGIPAVIHSISPRSEEATLEDNIKRLTDELNKTAAFYQSRHPETTINTDRPLLLSGDLTLVTPAHRLLQTETNYPIKPLAPPVDCPPSLPASSYMINIGLALKKWNHKVASGSEATRCHDININIFSDKYRKLRAKPLPVRYILLWLFMAIALVLLFPLYQSLDKLKDNNARLQTEFSNISRELYIATFISEENAQTNNAILEILAETVALQAADQSLVAGRGDFNRDLQLVTKALPPLTYLSSIEIDNRQVTVSGETESVFNIVDYASALALIEIFTDVRITEIGETTRIMTGDNATDEPVTFSLVTFDITIKK
jgi:Tfp pilus assembly PilM family ATPase/Tfp pilus assembly protein PilN